MAASALSPGSSSLSPKDNYDVSCIVESNYFRPLDAPIYPIEPDVVYDWDFHEAEDPDRDFSWPSGVTPYPRLQVRLYEQGAFLRLYTDCDGIKKVAVTDGVEDVEFVSESGLYMRAAY